MRYKGTILNDKALVLRLDDKRTTIIRPEKSQKLRNHSPDGFNWGYLGSGPAQLALALMLDFLGNPEMAQDRYQQFKLEVISRIPQGEDWELTGAEIEMWMNGEHGNYFVLKFDGANK